MPPHIWALSNACLRTINHGLLPQSGGMDAQAALFCEALVITESELAKWRKEQQQNHGSGTA